MPSATPSVELVEVQYFERPLRFRLPFRFGVATLTSSPQVLVRARVRVGGGAETWGVTSETLLPKWFDKSPALSEADNIEQLRRSLAIATAAYRDAGRAGSAFELHVRAAPRAIIEGAGKGLNPLVAGYGVALLDRAVIDAVCKSGEVSFFKAVAQNRLGIDGSATPELKGWDWAGFLAALAAGPAARKWKIGARHTVGMVDALTRAEAEAMSDGGVDDGLPRSLEAAIGFYGLRNFKLKLSGKPDADLDRLRRIAAVIDAGTASYRCTLDGNEQFTEVAVVVDLWDRMAADPRLRRLTDSILFIEQPISRSVAEKIPVHELARRRPVEIDESDATLSAFQWARELGYTGVSSKSCKGVYRSLLNRARCDRWNQDAQGPAGYFMSSEDLVVQAGVCLQQDLALAMLIGSEHIERNGHHYVNGMAHAPTGEQAEFARRYPHLYSWDGRVARLAIGDGVIDTSDLDAPGLGGSGEPDWKSLSPVSYQS